MFQKKSKIRKIVLKTSQVYHFQNHTYFLSVPTKLVICVWEVTRRVMLLPYLKTLKLEGSEVNLRQVLRRCRVESLSIRWVSSVSGLYDDKICSYALKKLDCAGAELSDDEIPLILQKFHKLQYLDVRCTNFSGESMLLYNGSLSLKTLICSYSDTSNVGLISFLLWSEKLEHLEISENKALNIDLVKIIQIIPGLTFINARMTSITAKSLKFYKGPQPVLQHLNLSYCNRLTDEDLLDIFNVIGNSLKYLNINYSDVTGRNLCEINGPLPCLETFLCGCTKFEDTGVRALIEKTRSTLRNLGVFRTELTEGYREEIKQEFPSLILDRDYTVYELFEY